MTDWSDLHEEMGRLGLDNGTIDRLLTRRIGPDDAPPGYSEVAHLLKAAAAPAEEELAHETEHVAMAIALLREPSHAAASSGRRPQRTPSRPHRVKVGALVMLGALVGSTGLAVAGVLPDAAQDAFSAVLERVGISVPASGDQPASTGEEIAETATNTPNTGVDKGATVSSVATGGTSQASQHGSAAAGRRVEGLDETPVPVPNAAGSGTTPAPVPHESGPGDADPPRIDASGEGIGTADERGDGRSGADSENASSAASVASAPPVASTPSDAPVSGADREESVRHGTPGG
jgi:hypothetical protein